MIKKTFIVFTVLFIGLNLWLSHWKGMDDKSHAGVYIRNNIRHEKFILSDYHYDTVLVGSSMASGLNLDKLFKESVNLTSEGGSFSSGLYFIKKKDRLPSVVLLEVNAFVRYEVDLITQPYKVDLFNKVKSQLPLLQSKNRMVCNTIYNSLPAFEKVIFGYQL